MKINKVETGIRLRDFRLSLGMTQAEFAEATDTDQPAISAYEKGTRLPASPFFTRLTKLYGTTQEWFTTGSGPQVIKSTQKADPQIRISMLEKKVDFMEKKTQILEDNMKKMLDMMNELAKTHAERTL